METPHRSRSGTSTSPRIRIGYVSGRVVSAQPGDWSSLPSEGVDWVELGNDVGMTRISGQSVYWLYREGPMWVLGGGPIGYTNTLCELLVPAVGNHAERQIEYMPDLPHSAVKLGHWWPGKERPPHG